MALTVVHELKEVTLTAYTPSLGSQNVAGLGYIRAPFRGKITKVAAIQNAAVTGTSTVTTAINGTAITGGAISVTGGSAGSVFSATPTAANNVVEDDAISFTPAGATGASIAGHYSVTIRKS